MIELKQEELQQIKGGINWTGALVTAFTDVIKSIFTIGRSVGSAFRRIGEDHICPLK